MRNERKQACGQFLRADASVGTRSASPVRVRDQMSSVSESCQRQGIPYLQGIDRSGHPFTEAAQLSVVVCSIGGSRAWRHSRCAHILHVCLVHKLSQKCPAALLHSMLTVLSHQCSDIQRHGRHTMAGRNRPLDDALLTRQQRPLPPQA
jgi:hypothetical protein